MFLIVIFCFILCILSVNLRPASTSSNIHTEATKASFVYIYSKRMRDLPWVSDKGNSLKICLLRNFNNYLVLLPDVTREQIKFTLFSDIQLTYFNLYFFLGLKYTNLFYLEWGANLNYYQKEKKKLIKTYTKGNKCCVRSDKNQSNPRGPAVIGLTHLHCQKVKSYKGRSRKKLKKKEGEW